METLNPIPAWQIAIAFFALLTATVEAGVALGRRAGWKGSEGPNATFMSVMGAVLGLVSLVMGFSYSMAGSRFDQRKQLLVQEVNALGTSYLQANLLDDPARSKMRDLLRDLVDARVARWDDWLDSARSRQAAAQSERFQEELWELVAAEARRDPQSLNTAHVVHSVSDVIDAIAARTAILRNRLPETILWMLLVAAVISAALIGYACGKSHERNLIATTAFAAILAVVTFALFDLERPRRGLIRADQQVLVDFQSGIQAEH